MFSRFMTGLSAQISGVSDTSLSENQRDVQQGVRVKVGKDGLSPNMLKTLKNAQSNCRV